MDVRPCSGINEHGVFKQAAQKLLLRLGVTPDVAVVPTGLSATGSVSQPAVVGEGEFAATGQAGTGQVGSVTVVAAAGVSVTLADMTGSLGNGLLVRELA